MAGYGSLFERLGGTPNTQSKNRAEAARDSVTAHLSNMLSTRAGSVLALPDYGMPDLNNMGLSLHEALTEGRKAIEIFVRTYEPRLTEVQVNTLPSQGNSLNLAFSIEGLLDVGGCKTPVILSARIAGDGQVNVR